MAQGPVDDGGADEDTQGEEDYDAGGKPVGVMDGGGQRGVAVRIDAVGGGRRGGKRPGGNRAGRWHIGEFDSGDEGVALTRDGFDEGGLVGRIAQDLAELVNGGVDVGVKVDVDVGRPQTLTKSFTSDDFAGLLDEDKENFADFSRQFDASAFAIERLAAKIINKG